jgi:hypothetical protein
LAPRALRCATMLAVSFPPSTTEQATVFGFLEGGVDAFGGDACRDRPIPFRFWVETNVTGASTNSTSFQSLTSFSRRLISYLREKGSINPNSASWKHKISLSSFATSSHPSRSSVSNLQWSIPSQAKTAASVIAKASLATPGTTVALPLFLTFFVTLVRSLLFLNDDNHTSRRVRGHHHASQIGVVNFI